MNDTTQRATARMTPRGCAVSRTGRVVVKVWAQAASCHRGLSGLESGRFSSDHVINLPNSAQLPFRKGVSLSTSSTTDYSEEFAFVVVLMLSVRAARWQLKAIRPRWSGIPLCLGGEHASHSALVRTGQRELRPRDRSRQIGSVRKYRATNQSLRHGEPTIYALSTAPGRAAIAIIRISGPACLGIYRALCPRKPDPRPRYASVRTLYEPEQPPSHESILDSNSLVLFFPAPRTVTGEDVLELHVHGGPAVVKAVLTAISKCQQALPESQSIRYAEPGEFTRRAFMNDRLDLTQVEALGDTLSATTEQQRRLSVRGTTSSLGKSYEKWRQQLLYARGELEALIDFSEDQHFDESPAELCASVAAQVGILRSMIQAHARNAMRGELLRSGISIALLGSPNAGKSSLLNCIVGREAAIVSHEAGTTRDVVEVGIDLGGYFCRLGDTAGLRKAKDAAVRSLQPEAIIGQIEEEGMRRAKARAAESDVVIAVLNFEPKADGSFHLNLDPEVVSSAASLAQGKNNVIIAINKCDILPSSSNVHESSVQQVMAALPGIHESRIHLISCKDAAENARGQHSPAADQGNIQSFLQGLIKHFESMTAAIIPADFAGADRDDRGVGVPDPSIWQDSLGASERHRVLLEQCLSSLENFLAEVTPDSASYHDDLDNHGARQNENEIDIVVAAEHLRAAADCLSKITGRGEAGDVEEVLGVVFEKFCVGK